VLRSSDDAVHTGALFQGESVCGWGRPPGRAESRAK